MAYETENLRRKIREAAELAIAAVAVNIYPDTEAHRVEQLKSITDKLTPYDWLELLKDGNSVKCSHTVTAEC